MRPGELLLDADRPVVARGAARATVVVPAVASVALAPVLGDRAVVDGVVVSAGSTGIVIDLGGAVALVARRGAVRLPLSLHVAAVPRVVAGSRVEAADGVLHLGDDDGTAITVGRWFDPRVSLDRPFVPAAIVALAAAVAAHGGADPLLDPAASRRLADALATGADLRATAGALLGRGGGLTPAGDDVLAGALAALAAVGGPGAEALGALAGAVLPVAASRTTTLSAALLAHAARAEVAEPARTVLRALVGGDPAAVAAAAGPLLSLGHTSGHHLAAGIAIGARVAVAP